MSRSRRPNKSSSPLTTGESNQIRSSPCRYLSPGHRRRESAWYCRWWEEISSGCCLVTNKLNSTPHCAGDKPLNPQDPVGLWEGSVLQYTGRGRGYSKRLVSLVKRSEVLTPANWVHLLLIVHWLDYLLCTDIVLCWNDMYVRTYVCVCACVRMYVCMYMCASVRVDVCVCVHDVLNTFVLTVISVSNASLQKTKQNKQTNKRTNKQTNKHTPKSNNNKGKLQQPQPSSLTWIDHSPLAHQVVNDTIKFSSYMIHT